MSKVAAESLIERRSVLAKVTAWGSEDVFLLVGAPGTGKSQIARQVAKMLNAGFTHFCDAQDDVSLSPLRFVTGLALALAEKFPQYAAALVHEVRPDITINASIEVNVLEDGARAEAVVVESLRISDMPARAAFDRLIRAPLEGIIPAKETFVVVVDAIDESLDFRESGHLVDLLVHARNCPVLKFFLTSRSGDLRVEDRLGRGSLDLDQFADGDLLEYSKLRLTQLSEPHRSLLADKIAATGNFLYAHHVLNDLSWLQENNDVFAARLPDSLTEIYRKFLKRTIVSNRRGRDWVGVYRPVLGALAVGRGRDGIHLSLIAAATGLPVSATMDALLACGQFVRLNGTRPDNTYARIYHRSFRDFLLHDDDFTVYPVEAHAAVAGALDPGNWRTWSAQQRKYGFPYLATHLNEGGLAEALIALAGDRDYLSAQRNACPNEPDIDVTTLRQAIQAAYAAADPMAVANLVLNLAARIPGMKARTPLLALKRYGLTAALATSAEEDTDLRTADELLLVLYLIEARRENDARHVAYSLLTRKPSTLRPEYAACAGVALARLCQVDWKLALDLTSRVLGIWGSQNLVRHLLDLRQYGTAAQVANTLADWDVRYKVFMAIAEKMLDDGEVDEALDLYDSIGESVDPDNSPAPTETLWWIFREVVWVVGVSLAMKGDIERGRAVHSRRFGGDQGIDAPELHAAAAFAASHAGDRKAASAEFSVAEALAARCADTRDEGSHPKALAWTHIGKAYMWCGETEKAKNALRIATRCLSPFETMQDLPFYQSPIHDDPFHGPCIQGTYRNLASLSARIGEDSTALTLAMSLAQRGSRDALDPFAIILASPGTSQGDREESLLQMKALIERIKAPFLAPAVAHLTQILSQENLRSFLPEVQSGGLCLLLDTLLHPASEDSDRPSKTSVKVGLEDDWLIPVAEAVDESVDLGELSYEELRALPDLPQSPGTDAFSSIRVSQQAHARAYGWARIGYHAQAIRQFDLALHWEAAAREAWSAFQAMAEVPKTTESFAREDNDAAARHVLKLCELAGIAAMAEDEEGATVFLARAQRMTRETRFEETRSLCAARIASTAARYGILDLVTAMLPKISIQREEFFLRIWASFCQGSAERRASGFPPELSPVFLGMNGSPDQAIVTCESLVKIFPAYEAAITQLVKSCSFT